MSEGNDISYIEVSDEILVVFDLPVRDYLPFVVVRTHVHLNVLVDLVWVWLPHR